MTTDNAYTKNNRQLVVRNLAVSMLSRVFNAVLYLLDIGSDAYNTYQA